MEREHLECDGQLAINGPFRRRSRLDMHDADAAGSWKMYAMCLVFGSGASLSYGWLFHIEVIILHPFECEIET